MTILYRTGCLRRISWDYLGRRLRKIQYLRSGDGLVVCGAAGNTKDNGKSETIHEYRNAKSRLRGLGWFKKFERQRAWPRDIAR